MTSIAHDPRIEIVLRQLRGADSVLDVGCVQHDAERAISDHWLHGELAHMVDNLIGMDFLSEEVEKLNDRGYNVVCDDAETFSFNREFDAIVAGELIEHLANPGSFLERAQVHLHDDGQLVLTTPNPWYGRRLIEALAGRVRCNPEHTCWFDEQTICHLLSRYGFTTDVVRYAPAPRLASPPYALMNLESRVTTAIYRVGFQLFGGYSLVVVATPQ